MKTKLQKTTKYLAAGIFVFALAFNVIVISNNPFAIMSDVVIADVSSSSRSSCAAQCSYDAAGVKCNACCSTFQTATCDMFGCKCTSF